jgi:hypothetical protein
MAFLLSLIPLGYFVVLGQLPPSTGGSEWSLSNVAILIWIIGQVAVMVIQAIRGNPVVDAHGKSIEQLQAAMQEHNTNMVNMANQMLPPEVAAQLVAIAGNPDVQQTRQRMVRQVQSADRPDPRLSMDQK